MADDTLDTNIAITLRDIAANCDEKSGKAIRLCEKAARQGLDHIELKVSVDDRDYLNTRKRAAYEGHWYDDDRQKLTTLSVPPLIQKLESLGFKLESSDRTSFWANDKCFIIARW
jgi:hypothetical protein